MPRIKGQWIRTDELETHTFDIPYVRPLTLLFIVFLIVGIIGGIPWRMKRQPTT